MTGYALAGAAVLAFVVAAVALEIAPYSDRTRRLIILAPFAVAFALMVFERRAVLYLQVPISVDEGQFLADAVKIASGRWVPWVDVDTGTVGPVVPYSLVPIVAALPDTPYLGARLLAIGCAVAWSAGSYLAVRTLVPASVALLLASPLIFIAAVPGSGDLNTFSSELVPLALTVLGAGLAMRGLAAGERTRLLVIGFLLIGLVPFAKLQVAPIAAAYAAAILLFGLALDVRRRGMRPIVVAIAAGLAPLVLVLVAAGVWGQLRERLRESLLFVQGYQAGGDPWRVTLAWFLQAPLLRTLEQLALIGAIVAVVLILVVGQSRMNPQARALGAIAVLSPIGFVCMSLPGRGFPHYVWVGAVPAVFGIAAAIAIVVSQSRLRWYPLRRLAVPVLIAAVVLAVGFERAPDGSGSQGLPYRITTDVWDPSPYFPPDRPPTSPTGFGVEQEGLRRVVAASCTGPVAIWGWDPGALVAIHRGYVTRSSVVPEMDPVAQDTWVQIGRAHV